MSTKILLIAIFLVVASAHALAQAVGSSKDTAVSKVTQGPVISSTKDASTVGATTKSPLLGQESRGLPVAKSGKSNSTALTNNEKQASSDKRVDKKDEKTAKTDPKPSKASTAIKEGATSPIKQTAASDSKSTGPKDLSTAEGHHGKKYVLVKKKPKHKKIKMEVYKPKMKYKKIKMKVPVKKMKKKKVKGYLVKKKHHH